MKYWKSPHEILTSFILQIQVPLGTETELAVSAKLRKVRHDTLHICKIII